MKTRGLIAFVGMFSLALSVAPTKLYAGQHAHHSMRPSTSTSPSTREYENAMVTMHKPVALSGNEDVDFVRMMIPHHQGAVDMAKTQLAYGHDEKLKRFSRWVISAQLQEIAFMKQWLRRHDNGLSSSKAPDYYGDAMAKMHHEMMGPYSGDADVDFVSHMIPHHQGAVDMADIWVARGRDPELRELIDGIYRAQSYEIAWMQYRLAHGSTSFPIFNP